MSHNPYTTKKASKGVRLGWTPLKVSMATKLSYSLMSGVRIENKTTKNDNARKPLLIP